MDMDDEIKDNFNFQGFYEEETSSTGEAALPELFQRCTKHPGHEEFMAPNDFSLDNLPCQYRDAIVLQLIKAISELTVLVAVHYTSLDRPESCPKTPHPDPIFNLRGQCSLRTGSGIVWSVGKFKKNKRPCPCTKCVTSPKPCRSWAEVTVVTASHLVFNDEEGRRTKCRLWYEDDVHAGVDLEGLKVIGSSHKRDRCVIKCVTCDKNVIKKLSETCVRYKRLCKAVHDKFGDFRNALRMTVVVAHPHGCQKKITVGKWIERKELSEIKNLTSYTYTAPTCPGSSGAPVYTLGGGGRWWLSIHTHMGVSDEGNQSGFGWE